MAPRSAPSWMVWTNLWIVYIVWGSTYLAIALVVQTMPPLLSAGARFILAGLMLAAWLSLRRGPSALRVPREQLVGAAVIGGALLLGGNGLVMLAEREVPSGLAALIIASVPLWVLLFRFISGDRVPRLGVIGVLAGIAGVAMLVVPAGLSGAVGLVSLLFIVVAPISWAWGSFMSTRLALPRDLMLSLTYQQLLGGALLIAAGLVTGEAAGVAAGEYSTASLLSWLYLVVFGSLVAFSAYTWLLQHAPVSTVATYAYVNPVVAVLLGTVFLSEAITPAIGVGAAIVLAAVALIVRAPGARVPAPRPVEGGSPAD